MTPGQFTWNSWRVSKEIRIHSFVGGILTTMQDARATIYSSILEQAKEDFEDLIFTSVIKSRNFRSKAFKTD